MQKHGTSFTKTRLAASLSIALGVSSIAPVALAQEASADDVEVINVKGVRGSLIRSMDVKRSSDGIVDVISAEDMGKFPDTNLAESMQRITGVAIDRSNGEGSEITVRGWGPQQNLVLFNGRQMPSSTGSRSFDFANIASEGVSGVEVQKTGNAAVATGGIGATVNILTNRPLNNAGTVAVLSGKLVNDTSTDKGSVTPEIAGIYSTKFDDGKFGVSITGSIQKRESGNQQAQVGTGWRSFDGEIDNDWSDGVADWGGVPNDDSQINRPGADDIYSVPQTTIYRFEEQQRTRKNAQLVLQYRPVDTLTATLDYTFFENATATQHQDVSAWYNFGPSENVWTDGPIASPLLYSETFSTPADLSMAAGKSTGKSTTNSIGLNLEWEATDDLKVTLDYHNSDSDWGADGPWGTSSNLSMAGFVRTSAATDFTGDLPILSVGGGNDIEWSDMRVTGSVFGNGVNTQEIEQTQLDFEYNLNDSTSIDFGVAVNEVSNRVQNVNVQRNDWGGVGEEGDFEEEWFKRDTIHDKFDVSGGDFSVANQLNDPTLTDFTILDTIFFWDFEAIRQRASELYDNTSTIIGDCGNSFCPSTQFDQEEDRTTNEKSTSAYVKVNWETDIGDMYLRLDGGLRYEKTEVVSTSAVVAYDSAAWVADTEIVLDNDGQDFLNQKGDYDYLLPSLNVSLEVTDDIVVRAAYSETISRSDYSNLLGGTSAASLANQAGGSGSAGNPSLLPLESTNFDLSFEWYYDDVSYVSVGYFTKDVVNFISSVNVDSDVFNLANPADGEKSDAARAALDSGATGAEIREYIFANYADDPYVDVINQIITGDPATDNTLIFIVGTPTNSNESRTVDGLELAVQHFFGGSGFGVMANYTYVNSDLEYDNYILEDQAAILGLSDTANLIGVYEKDGLSVRLAYNWRDEFLNARGQDTGQSAPQYTEEYSQWDLNASYEIPSVEGLSVFVEALNITDEYTRISGRATEQVLNLTQTGARYNVGARYRF
ncbi:MAG: TonB-dependent receptor [Paraglaciecola sp.]|uniref:TonB-dependent receptor n=1 Tax=Paraglaciecola sp. TaxID=1920173 RepID=UPI0032970B53